MLIIHILTKGFTSGNGCAFLFPLIRYRSALRDRGMDLYFFYDIQKRLYECDLLIVESKFFSQEWSKSTDRVLEKFIHFREKIAKVYYFDISDSTGWPHARVLPYVDRYFKNQLLKDKNLYLKPLYAHRIYTDYYYHQCQVTDLSELYSETIQDPRLLDKLAVGWNSGLADYSLRGPYRSWLYRYFPYSFFLSEPRVFFPPAPNRINDVSCRMGITYARNTVSWQRTQIKEMLRLRTPTDKLSRRQYYQELVQSKIIVSPFGLGEITLKDFEVFLTGGLLLKPDMSHLETWPDFFRNQETMITHRWDLTDLVDRIEEVLASYKNYVSIAEEAQSFYKTYLVGSGSEYLFCDYFSKILQQK